jgi:hypothetical protein
VEKPVGNVNNSELLDGRRLDRLPGAVGPGGKYVHRNDD